MREGPYRDGAPAGPIVYRASYLKVLWSACLALGGAALTSAMAYAIYEEGAAWQRIGLLLFLGVATSIMVWIAVTKAVTRIVMERQSIASVTPAQTVTLAWERIARVERLVVNDNVTYILHGVDGGQINVGDDLRDFEHAKSELRTRLGSLPGE